MRSCAQTATLPLGGMQELDVCVVQIPRHPELIVDYANCGGSLCHRCLSILAQQHLHVIAHTFPVAKPFFLVTEGKISRFDARDGADTMSVVWQMPALVCLRVYRWRRTDEQVWRMWRTAWRWRMWRTWNTVAAVSGLVPVPTRVKM